MTLDAEVSKSVAFTEKDTDQNELTVKKLKRIFEVSSVICSAASINMIIACLYGGVSDILGFKSREMIFDLAFSFLVASVVLGTLAMATSRIQDRKLHISFPSLGISTLFSSLLTVLSFIKKYIACCEKVSKPSNTQPVSENAECIQILKGERNDQVHSNSLDNLSIINNEDAKCSLKYARRGTEFFPSSDKSSETKSPSQSQKSHAPFLFGHCSVTQSTNHFTKSLKFMQFDLEQVEKKSQLVPPLQQTFITNGHFNKVNTRNIPDKHPQVGIVSPIKINNSNDIEYYDLHVNISPSVGNIRTCQKQLNRRFNPHSLLEQQSFYQDTGRMSNTCFKVDNHILYDSNASIKTFHKFPSSQQEVLNNWMQTTNFQNLHEVPNKFSEVKCYNSHEKHYTNFLQTIPESSDEFSNKRSGIGSFNLQDLGSGAHCYKLNQKVTPNFKSIQHPLRDFKVASHSQVGIINPHVGWNINSKECGENFVERPDIPMEICDKVPNDQVLEISMKLNDLNFIF